MKVDRHRRARRIFWWTAWTLSVVGWIALTGLWVVTAELGGVGVKWARPDTNSTTVAGKRCFAFSHGTFLLGGGYVQITSYSYAQSVHKADATLSLPPRIDWLGWERVYLPHCYFLWDEREPTFLGKLGFRGWDITTISGNGRTDNAAVTVPIWVLEVLSTVAVAVFGYRWRQASRVQHRESGRMCAACGYDLRGSAGACPECGAKCGRVDRGSGVA